MSLRGVSRNAELSLPYTHKQLLHFWNNAKLTKPSNLEINPVTGKFYLLKYHEPFSMLELVQYIGDGQAYVFVNFNGDIVPNPSVTLFSDIEGNVEDVSFYKIPPTIPSLRISQFSPPSSSSSRRHYYVLGGKRIKRESNKRKSNKRKSNKRKSNKRKSNKRII